MIPLQTAIIKTITYADIFDYPLTATEIHRFLIIDTLSHQHKKEDLHKIESKPITQTSVNSALSVLLNKRRLSARANFYFLPTRQSIVSLRQQREKVSHSKITRAKKLTQKLALLPNIQGIFLTGALAMKNADRSDDIDLLIITQPHTLWSTRFIINLITDALNLRRRPQPFHLRGGYSRTTSKVKHKSHSDKLCLNMWLDQTALALPKTKQNLYTAHEVAQVIPLVNKNHTHEQFLLANSWMTKYLPHVIDSDASIHRYSPPDGHLVVKFLNKLSFDLQYRYMRQKITRETITPHAAFFHPRDTSGQILRKYNHHRHSILNNNPQPST